MNRALEIEAIGFKVVVMSGYPSSTAGSFVTAVRLTGYVDKPRTLDY